MEIEVATFKNIVKNTTKIHDIGVQTKGKVPKKREASGHALEVDQEEDVESGKEIEIRTIKSLLIHKINTLKQISQNVHSNYIVLQGVEYRCSQVFTLLSSLFTTWGPYTQFFDSLVPLLPQKKHLPKV